MGKFFKTRQLLGGIAYYNEPPAPAPTPEPPPGKVFTQADVDRFMAEDRRKSQAKQAELIKKVEELSQNENLTKEQKAQLETQLEDLRNQSLTKEQQLTRDLEKRTTEIKTVQETLTKDRDSWQSRYATLLIRQRITEASADAIQGEQILELLMPRAKVAEIPGEDGKGSGEFAVMIKFNDIDAKTKQPITLDLSPADTVKRMKELPERFGNLFKSTTQGGLGKNKSGGPVGEPDYTKMTPEEHRKLRKERGY